MAEQKEAILIEWPPESYYDEGYDQFDQYSDWEFITAYLTELMEARNDGSWWHVEVNNFGWRALDGYKEFQAGSGQELLWEILPKTDCSFRIYDHDNGKGLKINNAHHDSPVWAEWYYIVPMPLEERD